MFDVIMDGFPILDCDDLATVLGVGPLVREKLKQGIVILHDGKRLDADDLEIVIKVKSPAEATNEDEALVA